MKAFLRQFVLNLAWLSTALGVGFFSTPATASEPFLGQLKMVAFNFPPRGWAFTDGQLLPINQNQSLFSLLGTTYGGDGRTDFALPDLRGRIAIHPGQGPGLSSYSWGQRGGEENVVLNVSQIPAHTHPVNAVSMSGNNASPSGRYAALHAGNDQYKAAATPDVNMRSDMLVNSGGNQGHNNMQPFIVINQIIALQGLFPSRD